LFKTGIFGPARRTWAYLQELYMDTHAPEAGVLTAEKNRNKFIESS